MIPSDQQGITACFAQHRGSSSTTVDCFGRTFPKSASPSPGICQGSNCLSLNSTAQKLGMRFELLDASGAVIDTVPVHFNSFPMIRVEASTAAPPPEVSGFFNFCAPNQSRFYTFDRYFVAYGDVLTVPAPGARLHAYGNFLLPNDIIAQTASLRVHIVQN